MAQANLGQAPQERGLDEYPPEWKAEFLRLTDTIFNLAARYPDQVQILVWDPRSLQGMLRSIRHMVRHYPTFIINGRTKITGWDTDKLEQQIQAAVKIADSAL